MTPIQHQARLIYRRAMAHQNAARAVLLAMNVQAKTAHDLAAFIIVFRWMDFVPELDEVKERLRPLIQQAKAVARLEFVSRADSAHVLNIDGKELTADYGILPASDDARKEMAAYRRAQGLRNGVVTSRSTKKHPPRFGLAGQLNPWFLS